MSKKRRGLRDLHDAILEAAADGRGLHLSPPEVELLARQPFVAMDPRILELEAISLKSLEEVRR